MPCFLHAAKVDGAVMFREWSTVVDAYTTEPMTREEAVRWCVWRRGMGEAAAVIRVDRTAIAGTSSMMGDTRSLDDGWDEEVCPKCGRFHHAFDPKFNGRCTQCGELREDKAHEERCRR